MRRIAQLIALLAAPALQAQTLPGVDYYCTGSSGERHELGAVICISASCQTWMARCAMSLNSPTWRKIQDGCPGASLLAPLSPSAGRVPPATLRPAPG